MVRLRADRSMIRVAVAADAAVVRAGLAALVAASPDLTVVGHSVSLAELPQLLEELQPEVVLVDLEDGADDAVLDWLPGPVPSLIEGEGVPAVPLVLLTEETAGSWLADVLRSGVRALLPRTATAAEITAAITAAAGALVAIHPDLLGAMLSALPGQPRPPTEAPEQPLTPREVEVLSMLAEGLGNKTIARRLQISEHTVKFHIGSIFGKLEATSRTEAVTLGVRRGLIML